MPGLTKHEVELDPKYDHYDYPVDAPTPQSGHPGWTTPEQDAQVFQLRTMLEQEGYTDNLDTLTMLRFLRARKFDVQKSLLMFKNCAKWRSEFGGGLDKLVPIWDYVEKPQVFEYYPQYYHKTDKDGRPVYIEHLGKIDIRKMQTITTDERMLQNLVVEYEKLADPRLPACSRKAGHLLETCCTIMDAKGVGITSVPSVYGYLQRASAISQDYYPERLGKMYIVNAPWGFAGCWNVIKRFLDPVTVDKIHILGTGYEKELLKQVPAENLPTVLGGTCECDGGCMLSDDGPWKDPQWTKPPKWAKGEEGAETNDADVKDQKPLGTEGTAKEEEAKEEEAKADGEGETVEAPAPAYA